jgi:hypothetical protein
VKEIQDDSMTIEKAIEEFGEDNTTREDSRDRATYEILDQAKGPKTHGDDSDDDLLDYED